MWVWRSPKLARSLGGAREGVGGAGEGVDKCVERPEPPGAEEGWTCLWSLEVGLEGPTEGAKRGLGGRDQSGAWGS